MAFVNPPNQGAAVPGSKAVGVGSGADLGDGGADTR